MSLEDSEEALEEDFGPEEEVICYNCGEVVPQSEAFYIVTFDAYFCEVCYLALLEKKPVKLPNWRK